MSIWKRQSSLEAINEFNKGTLIETLGIVFTEIGEDYLTAIMPIDNHTKQPFGMLHGGASVALGETVAGIAANLTVADDKVCFGLEINANHIKAARSGFVTGKATPLHMGSTTQVWQIEITNDEGKLVCISRHTIAVLNNTQKTEI